ncbi:MAG: pilus assembly protein [Deltaproteobacteria bacterium]|nr:pilus assembly protein [Deltaproteobacteria bacterium]
MKTSTIIKPQKGAAAVELAVVISILVLLAVGVCEFGILFYNKQVLVNASREGARAGTTRADDCDETDEICQIVLEYCDKRLVTFGSDVEPVLSLPDGPPAGKGFQEDFSIGVTYEHQFLAASLFGLDSPRTLTAITLMKMEAPAPVL